MTLVCHLDVNRVHLAHSYPYESAYSAPITSVSGLLLRWPHYQNSLPSSLAGDDLVRSAPLIALL